jgi:rubrerythrin
MNFLDKLRKAIDDEYTAAIFYGKLKKATKDPLYQEFIEHAREDEKKHFQLFQQLHSKLTGSYYENKKNKKEFKTFQQGVEMALKDELEAGEMYRDMLFEMPTNDAYYSLFVAMTDEMEHATRFAAIYGSMK